jgi:hypothetical protein
MRLLLLDTDEAIRSFMPDLLAVWLAKSPQAGLPRVVVEDGSRLSYPRAVSLLQEGYDSILINLRLPSMLSLRLAELVHLAKVPTRLVLLSGAPQDLSASSGLFDGYIRIPFYEKSPEAELEGTLGRPFLPEHRPLVSQEHLDVSLLNLLQKYDSLAPGCRGALHAFGLYRDAYLHRPLAEAEKQLLLPHATLAERLNYFTAISPLNFSQRILGVMEAVDQSQFYLPRQKRFLAFQFNHLLDALGLTLMNFRAEIEEILKGLEQFARMAGSGGTDVDPASLGQMLLARSASMHYVHEAIIQIVRLLPGTG